MLTNKKAKNKSKLKLKNKYLYKTKSIPQVYEHMLPIRKFLLNNILYMYVYSCTIFNCIVIDAQ